MLSGVNSGQKPLTEKTKRPRLRVHVVATLIVPFYIGINSNIHARKAILLLGKGQRNSNNQMNPQNKSYKQDVLTMTKYFIKVRLTILSNSKFIRYTDSLKKIFLNILFSAM